MSTTYWTLVNFSYYRCNNYVARKVWFCVSAWTWRHRHSHLNCLTTQGSSWDLGNCLLFVKFFTWPRNYCNDNKFRLGVKSQDFEYGFLEHGVQTWCMESGLWCTLYRVWTWCIESGVKTWCLGSGLGVWTWYPTWSVVRTWSLESKLIVWRPDLSPAWESSVGVPTWHLESGLDLESKLIVWRPDLSPA